MSSNSWMLFLVAFLLWLVSCQKQEQTVVAPKRDYTVSGRVLTGEGGPVPQALVRIMDGATELGKDLTDATGQYSIPGVGEGTYTIRAEKRLYTVWSATLTIGDFDKQYNMVIDSRRNILVATAADYEELRDGGIYLFDAEHSPYVYAFGWYHSGDTIRVGPGVDIEFREYLVLGSKSSFAAIGTISEQITFRNGRAGFGFSILDSTVTAVFEYCYFDSLGVYASQMHNKGTSKNIRISYCKFAGEDLFSMKLLMSDIVCVNCTFETEARGVYTRVPVTLTRCELKGGEMIFADEFVEARILQSNLTSTGSPYSRAGGLLILDECFFTCALTPGMFGYTVTNRLSSPRSDAGCGW